MSRLSGECIDSPKDPCEGSVEYRTALSPSGKMFPRCGKHWAARLKVQEGINARYPERQPADFDPLYAGEQWDED